MNIPIRIPPIIIKKHNIIKCSGINQIDQLSPFEFETWVSHFLQKQGYRAYTTQKSGDYGIDVIAEKDQTKIAIQVKKYQQAVGIKAVQEVISGANYYECNEAWVVTSASAFTTAACTARSSCCSRTRTCSRSTRSSR